MSEATGKTPYVGIGITPDRGFAGVPAAPFPDETTRLRNELDRALAKIARMREALGEFREYAESVWFDEARATDEERLLMQRARAALAE